MAKIPCPITFKTNMVVTATCPCHTTETLTTHTTRTKALGILRSKGWLIERKDCHSVYTALCPTCHSNRTWNKQFKLGTKRFTKQYPDQPIPLDGALLPVGVPPTPELNHKIPDKTPDKTPNKTPEPLDNPTPPLYNKE